MKKKIIHLPDHNGDITNCVATVDKLTFCRELEVCSYLLIVIFLIFINQTAVNNQT